VRLLKIIEDYASVNLNATATHASGAELGNRLQVEIEEGTVECIMLEHIYTETVNGATEPTLLCTNLPSETFDITKAGEQADSLIIEKLGIDSNAKTAVGKDFIPRSAGNVSHHVTWSGSGEEAPAGCPLFGPWVTFQITITDSTAGIFTTKAYLYGQPRRFSDMKTGTVE